ncbi:MAG: hypothetical protein U0736_18005 [Gemmataceae bacterium]
MYVAVCVAVLAAGVAPPGTDDLAWRLRRFGEALPADDGGRAARADTLERLRDAGRRETAAWRDINNRTKWERSRDDRLARLRSALGTSPDPPRDLKVRVRRTLDGTGYHIDCLTFESRPGVVVTANLYRPAKPGAAMPGLLLCHSHHNPKTEGELQDMGVLWARAGCEVLVIDLLGHGERRQHPYRTAADFPAAFRPGRQDYYFRHNVGLHLQLIGDELMGWLCWDLMRGVDLLLSRPGIDPKQIVLLGAVAGGGDPAAVTAALDRRIAAAVVFNFGGPQPESRYPLPADAEESFLYAGAGSWEPTRNLARSARDGFLPWWIVAAIAPRRHVHAHEFSWDEERDPVWRRLRQVHRWYGTPDHLAATHGTGVLTGQPPTASHCNNIGPRQRKGIHEAFRRWIGITVDESPARERRPAAELLCLAPDERIEPVHRLAARLADDRATAARGNRGATPAEQRQALRRSWAAILGPIAPTKPPWVVERTEPPPAEGISARWIGLPGDSWVWGLELSGPHRGDDPRPTVVAVGQGGPRAFLRHRSAEIARHLRAGRVVVLAQLGGMSNTQPGTGRGRTSGATAYASSLLMLGEPALGQRLRELRTLLVYLRQRAPRLTVWGDSFAPPVSPGRRIDVPLDVDQPPHAEPLGALLALLAGLFEDDLAAIDARGGLVSYRSVLDSPFVHVPYDVIVPGAIPAGDLPAIRAALAPLPVRWTDPVDGTNRRASGP